MATPPNAEVDELLLRISGKLRQILLQPGINGIPLSLPEYDRQLWRLGQAWLEDHGIPMLDGAPVQNAGGPDVFLATQLYQNGGHTALIGDFVAALTDPAVGASLPHIVLTNIAEHHTQALAEPIRARTGVLPQNIHLLPGPSLAERLDQLLATLLDLKPRRLFLFHHPDDPLASVAAQPQIAEHRFLVHHVDANPTLGLHVPGARVIELNPYAAAVARARRLSPELLLLTAPDPGPRPHGFLGRGELVTATCGGAHKYASDYIYSYAEAVAVILNTTGGWHVHVGPLPADGLARISLALGRAGVAPDRFVYRPWVPSLAEALWEHRCDLYFSSFPIDGARAYVEVAASATPYLAHSTSPHRPAGPRAIGPRRAAVWSTWNELATALRSMCDLGVLEENARLIRRAYEDLHHPDVFRRTLRNIVAGEGGVTDPDEAERDHVAARSLIGSLEKAVIAGGEAMDLRLDRIVTEWRAARRESEDGVERLQKMVRSLEEAVIAKGEAIDRRLDEIATDGTTQRRTLDDALDRTQRMVRSLEEAMMAKGETIDRQLEQIALAGRAQGREWEEWLHHRRWRLFGWLSSRSRSAMRKKT